MKVIRDQPRKKTFCSWDLNKIDSENKWSTIDHSKIISASVRSDMFQVETPEIMMTYLKSWSYGLEHLIYHILIKFLIFQIWSARRSAGALSVLLKALSKGAGLAQCHQAEKRGSAPISVSTGLLHLRTAEFASRWSHFGRRLVIRGWCAPRLRPSASIKISCMCLHSQFNTLSSHKSLSSEFHVADYGLISSLKRHIRSLPNICIDLAGSKWGVLFLIFMVGAFDQLQ